MAHELQERYSALVDAKLRQTLVTRDGVIFNNRYEGDPKAGAVRIPVRDTEVSTAAYSRANGTSITAGTTEYLTITIDKDIAVNELIDGYEAATVPDGIVADRLDSAAYSLALELEKSALTTLAEGGEPSDSTTALTKSTVYEAIVDARTALSVANVPVSRRFLLVTPATYALLLKASEFIGASDIEDTLKQTGAIGQIAGFAVYESAALPENVEFIAGHPDWCTRVREWSVPVHLQDLSGSGKYIGASAVQGRMVFAHAVTKSTAVYVKQNA